MKIFFKKILLLFLLTTNIFISTTFVFAQKALEYEMVSFSPSSNDAKTPFLNLAFFDKPTFTINYQSFTNGFQFLFDLVIGISIATSIILFMYAAAQGIYNSGNTNQINQSKKEMQQAIFGLMIILSTWLIINTINPDLLRLPLFQGLEKLGQQKTSSNTTVPNVTAESTGR
jgi:accessory gene regulator protein AgrB